ncbi:aminomethyltransferase [Microvirga flocculans]|uniref:aminomethyltransferase n=1 Tax=Microvirga flocculans TaxID=217168 RepID=A0A7W6N846_9HYPH|nr:glycine cleavage system aminomethyltransferase GcvT [Microvirga flocculans]MBB4040155.1 aminomethyltransferase [Microvirga flocculans]
MAEPAHSDEPLLKTPLHAEHVALGARMVPFAGYDMPVQYPSGILTEHNWTREHAGLFDVSHMGQAFLFAEDKSHETVARALEALIPADVQGLKPNQQRYSQLLSEDGGILDDLMVTRVGAPGHEGWLYLVVNASMKEADYAHIEARLPKGVALRRKDDLGLMALQGPSAEAVLAKLAPEAAALAFMMSADVQIGGIWCHVSRSGYTGEDGFELSCHGKDAPTLWNKLLADPEVKPIGLGARDSLRLEAGLCLYGHDIDTTTSPIEAGLIWSIQKRRREEGGFPGAARVQREIKDGPARVRVGLKPEGRAPAREGTIITTPDGREVGIVTSGGFGPTVNGPVAMGYVAKDVSAIGTDLHLVVRGKPLPAKVAAMPFAPHRYKR